MISWQLKVALAPLVFVGLALTVDSAHRRAVAATPKQPVAQEAMRTAPIYQGGNQVFIFDVEGFNWTKR